MNSYGNIQLINNSDKDSGNTLQLSSQATGKNKKSTVSDCIITTISKRKEYDVLGSINIIQGIMNLSAYLIKEEYNNFEDVIRPEDEIGNYDLFDFSESDTHQFESAIVLGAPKKKKPNWLNIIENEIDGDLEEYFNKSTRAVILVKVESYIIAYTFGFGRHLLRDMAIVKDFGIRVVMNIVNPQKIKGVDKTTVDENLINSRQQTNKDLEIENFSLDNFKDFVKTISGESMMEQLGTTVSGSDSLHFKYDLEYEDIFDLSTLLYSTYIKEEYKNKFPWYDNMRIEKDKEVICELFSELCNRLINNSECVDFVVPEIVDSMLIETIYFTPKGKGYDFDSNSICQFFLENDNELSYENIKNRRVYILTEDEDIAYNWKMIECLSTEIEWDEETYLLLSGLWFKIDKGFTDRINRELASLPITELEFVDSLKNEREEDYTVRLCGSNDSFLVMDQKFVDGIEVCDVYTKNKQFIHIKPWKSSSTLSHLFAQGRISGERMLNDITFRRQTIDKIEELDSNFANIDSDLYRASDYEIVYAIIYKEDKDPIDRIPFFSKINLTHTLFILNQMGYKVSIGHIKRSVS